MKAEYIDHMGSDLRVVNAARVSFDKESEYKYSCVADCGEHGWSASEDCPNCENMGLEERDQKLIKYLADHNHFTPFCHSVVTMRETIPIFVARQRFKHCIGFNYTELEDGLDFVYNEVSRRYVDDEPELYDPKEWRKRAENKKQGSTDEIVEINTLLHYDTLFYAEEMYKSLLKDGVAPEQARMVLPQSMYTSFYVTGSLAAWARAYKLRIDPHAQKEIQELAKQWDEIIRPLFPYSWSALVD